MSSPWGARRTRALCLSVLTALSAACATALPARERTPVSAAGPHAAQRALRATAPAPDASPAPILEGEMPRWGPRALFAASPGKKSAVQGIAGTLSAYDVSQAMDERAEALARCGGQGPLRLRIRVRVDGSVAQVALPRAGVQRSVERCLLEVLQGTRFPRPHGGEAEVAYTLVPARRR